MGIFKMFSELLINGEQSGWGLCKSTWEVTETKGPQEGWIPFPTCSFPALPPYPHKHDFLSV